MRINDYFRTFPEKKALYRPEQVKKLETCFKLSTENQKVRVIQLIHFSPSLNPILILIQALKMSNF